MGGNPLSSDLVSHQVEAVKTRKTVEEGCGQLAHQILIGQVHLQQVAVPECILVVCISHPSLHIPVLIRQVHSQQVATLGSQPKT
jgi:hypothetical protein